MTAILNLQINNVESDTKGIYDIINDELGDLSLMIRPTFNMVGEKSISDIILPTESLGPKELFLEQLRGYGSGDVDRLAIDLFDLLSKDKIEESKELIDIFYEENYSNLADVVEFKTESVEKEELPQEESEDVQINFNEVLK